jgi:hypothetical protein
VLETPSGGPLEVGTSEQVVVAAAGAESYAAPELDAWDRWNYHRTDGQLDSLSARYVGGDVYGASDLDQYGSWRTVDTYGPVWIPASVPARWAPYAAGRWLWDPSFGWTWLDDTPWGWAPFHYGRWIFLHGNWAWAPGPLGRRFYYAPALVAFYGDSRTRVVWVPLGWGEPCRPWWGPRRFIGQPHWLGWSGPRSALDVHRNAGVPGGAIAVPGSGFGRGAVGRIRIDDTGVGGLRLVRGALPVERSRLSYVGADEKARVPPAGVIERGVFPGAAKSSPGFRTPAPGRVTLPRPPFGAGPERGIPSAPPRYELPQPGMPKVKPVKPGKLPRTGPALPGEPANRVYRGRSVAPAPAPAAVPGMRTGPGIR